jgi:hypothetical protein
MLANRCVQFKINSFLNMNKSAVATLVISIFICGCSKSKIITVSKIVDQDTIGKIEVTKFMGNNEYPMTISQETFWAQKEEHAKFTILGNNFLQEIKTAKVVNELKNYDEPHYAFIITEKNKTDTVYSDSTLREWVQKNNGKDIYYHDEKAHIAKFLRQQYSFFNDCW